MATIVLKQNGDHAVTTEAKQKEVEVTAKTENIDDTNVSPIAEQEVEDSDVLVEESKPKDGGTKEDLTQIADEKEESQDTSEPATDSKVISVKDASVEDVCKDTFVDQVFEPIHALDEADNGTPEIDADDEKVKFFYGIRISILNIA